MLDDDASRGERGLLCGVAGETEFLGGVLDVVGSDGRVMGDLLDGEGCETAVVNVGPYSVEHFAEDRV